MAGPRLCASAPCAGGYGCGGGAGCGRRAAAGGAQQRHGQPQCHRRQCGGGLFCPADHGGRAGGAGGGAVCVLSGGAGVRHAGLRPCLAGRAFAYHPGAGRAGGQRYADRRDQHAETALAGDRGQFPRLPDRRPVRCDPADAGGGVPLSGGGAAAGPVSGGGPQRPLPGGRKRRRAGAACHPDPLYGDPGGGPAGGGGGQLRGASEFCGAAGAPYGPPLCGGRPSGAGPRVRTAGGGLCGCLRYCSPHAVCPL